MTAVAARQRPRSRVLLAAVALWLGGWLTACGGEPEAALEVGRLGFAAAEVQALSAEERALLADIAALGLAVADERVDSLVQPLVRRRVERSRLAAVSYELGARAMGLSGERLEAAYLQAPEWELVVRHVVRLVPEGAGAAERAEARRVAEEVARRAAAGEDFAALAARYSEEPGAAERGGLLQPGREGSWVDPFWEAASRLQPGEVSPVVETQYGFHVLRLDERRPVPLAEAARLPVLRRVVPPAWAQGAMDQWLAAQPPVVLDPPAVLAARRFLLQGEGDGSVELARGPSGRPYTARDLALAWTALGEAERESLRRADDLTFGQWVENDVREAFWAEAAAGLGVEAPRGVEAEAREEWRRRVAGWAAALGMRPGMSDERIGAAAIAALRDRGQEARIARREIVSLRPLLREAYPVVEPGAAPEAASSSEIRNSESTR